jgi:hypothetical protein
VDDEVNDLREEMRRVCDAAMPRVSIGRNTRRTAYWWNPEIAELREQCSQARRRFARAQRRRWTRNAEEVSRTYEAYRGARKTLQREIKAAKDRSWKELIEAVESDPLGRPYKVVLAKLIPQAPLQTESIDPEVLDQVVGALFPKQEARPQESSSFPSLSYSDSEEEEERSASPEEITNEELMGAVKKMASRDVAPGPDGIPGRIWAETIDLMAPRLRHPFNCCLRGGAYPWGWRVARLVLLKNMSPRHIYMPICLLDEVGKLFERIIAARLQPHMGQREFGWHDGQYGFCQGRSTIDAITHAKKATQEMVSGQGVAMAVSLNISNAFNTIPWYRIVEALRCYQVQKYLVEVIKTYLRDRWVEFGSQRGIERRPVERRVLQGSVLRPILWITAYDRVLRCPRPLGTEVICYADDTLVLAGGRWWNETTNLTEDAVACVIREIDQLELCVSPTKSEVLGFYDDRHRGPPPLGLTIKIGKGDGGTKNEIPRSHHRWPLDLRAALRATRAEGCHSG